MNCTYALESQEFIYRKARRFLGVAIQINRLTYLGGTMSRFQMLLWRGGGGGWRRRKGQNQRMNFSRTIFINIDPSIDRYERGEWLKRRKK